MKTQEIHIILDRSGSMHGKTNDVIGGLKENIRVLRQHECSTLISIKIFDDQQEILLKRIPLVELTDSMLDSILLQYRPRGQTALYDALGDSLCFYIQEAKLVNKQWDDAIIYVMTDGLENCSTKYTSNSTEKMVKEASDLSLKVLYIGSNQESSKEAVKIGIPSSQAIDFLENEECNKEVFRALGNAAYRSLKGEDVDFTQDERDKALAIA